MKDEIINLINFLNEKTKEYDNGHPSITDKEWDEKYFKLKKLEEKTGIIFPNSPTQRINYSVMTELKKREHNHLMLSLEKTKDIHEVESFFDNKKNFIAMSKMDGLTCSLRYENGKLISAETRGDGKVGEDVLHNALVISSIPKSIPYKEELIIDGEVICKKDNFTSFNCDYKNPRNFAAGSIRLLDSKECEKRNLTFVAWDVVVGYEDIDSLNMRLAAIEHIGFTVVPFTIMGSPAEAVETIKLFSNNNNYPIDGVVFKFLKNSYGKKLGRTDHHFKNAIAYKFYDETYTTFLNDIEWTMGRTGILTPVAIFDPIEIDGSIISRASLHNVSILNETLGTPYSRQKLEVYKSNMIIPQILSAEKIDLPKDNNSPEYLGFFPIITECPVCGKELKIFNNNGTKTLKCINENCEGQLINRLDHFCGKKGLDIKGLSKATISKLIDKGWLKDRKDIFYLKDYEKEWKSLPGFGDKSVSKVLNAIEEAKTTTFPIFLASLGIPLIGKSVSLKLSEHIPTYLKFREKISSGFDFSEYETFAESKSKSLLEYDYSEADEIYSLLKIKDDVVFNNDNNNNKDTSEMTLQNQNVVITGKLFFYKNREELKKEIERKGGKVLNTVNKNTTILINNDFNSTSSKNLSAKRLGIPVLSEEDYRNLYLI